MAYPIGDLREWSVLNDTIMGGSSSSACRLTAEGLLLEGNIVEQGGGFVSCRSPRFQPPLNLRVLLEENQLRLFLLLPGPVLILYLVLDEIFQAL